MSTLLQRIKSDQLAARKLAIKGDETARIKSPLLTTLVAEAERVGKDAGRETTDDEVTAVIRKFVKNLDETLKARPEDDKAKDEAAILAEYLPQAVSDDEVRKSISAAFEDRSMKNMKAILAYLNEMYPGRVTGQQVSAILKAGV